MRIFHPRVSPISAALSTSRELGIDIAILHGPAGCTRHYAREMELRGMYVLTTALIENDFIFGGQSSLIEVLQYAEKNFSPRRMAVIGTCVSMIIGDDLSAIIDNAGITTPTIAVNIHAGYSEANIGIFATFEAAQVAGWISMEEITRQRFIMEETFKMERLQGSTSVPFIKQSHGDYSSVAARHLLTIARSGRTGVAILNTKKNFAYLFADVLIALHDVCPCADITYIVNLADRGLPLIKADAQRIMNKLVERGVSFEIIGALDEYGVNGDALGKRIREIAPSFALIAGTPHAIPPEYIRDIMCCAVIDGPSIRVELLRLMGYQYIITEKNARNKIAGCHDIVESEFGTVIRSLALEVN